MTLCRILPGAILTAFLALPLAAQTPEPTRTETIAQDQADKAQTLHPYVPTTTERIFLAVKREFIDTPSGFYPLAGSVYSGTGFALGGGYRTYLHDRTYVDARGLWSFQNSKSGELNFESRGHLHNKVDFNARAEALSVPHVAFFGIGQNAPDHEFDLPFDGQFAGAGAVIRPFGPFVLGSRADYERYELGRNGNVFAPGVGEVPTYFHYSGSAGIDWRPSAGYARSGGLYEVRYHQYNGRNTTSFDRVEAEVVQHLPILRETWVVSAHGLVNSVIKNDTVPYLLLPSLGGSDSLRGYPAWRFRDRNSLLLQGEFRWIPNYYFMDMALFYDTGKVTPDRSSINLRGLKSDVGAEVRFHGPAQTPLRFGIARGNEGWHFVFGATAVF